MSRPKVCDRGKTRPAVISRRGRPPSGVLRENPRRAEHPVVIGMAAKKSYLEHRGGLVDLTLPAFA